MPLPLPENVFVSQTETLPRSMVASCGKSGCRRCGGAGWFRFSGTDKAWICPCAQKRAYERIAEAEEQTKPMRPLGAIQRATEQMCAADLMPAVVLCGPDVAAQLWTDEEAKATPKLAGTVDQLEGEFRIACGLRVLTDADAPANFARVFTAEEFRPYLRELFEKQAARRDDAKREARAKAELERQREELRGSRDE